MDYVSSSQQRCYAAWQQYDKHPRQHSILIHLQGTLHRPLLQQAIREVLQVHEIFRTHLEARPGIKYPVQVLADDHVYHPGMENEYIVLSSASDTSFTLRITLPACHADVTTLQLLYADIAAAYGQLTAKRELAMEPPLQYIDYAAWQQDLQAGVPAGAIALRQQVAALRTTGNRLEIGQLPGAIKQSGRKELLQPAPKKIFRELEQWAARYGHPVPAVLLFCWYHLLQRFNKNVVLGFHTMQRGDEQLQAMYGPFEKVLPLQISYSSETSVHEVIRQLEAAAAQLHLHQEYIAVTDAEGPLHFPYCFACTTPPGPLVAGKVTFSVQDMETDGAPATLRLFCQYYPANRLMLHLQYDAMEIGEQVAVHLLAGFWGILEGILDDGCRSVADLAAGIRECRLLMECNKSAKRHLPSTTAPAMFDAQVQQRPDHTALVYESTQYSYREAGQIVTQLAAALQQYGVRPGHKVAVYLQRTDRLVLALLAIWKAGAAFVPMDTQWPANRCAYVLADSEAQLCITDSPADLETPVLTIDAWFRAAANGVPGTPAPIDGCLLAYCIYTSGTTGQPKGVAITHASLGNYLQWFLQAFPVGPADSTVLFSSIAFDLPYTALWSALCGGATLYVAPETPLPDMEWMSRLLMQSRITYLKLTPSHFKMLLAAGDVARYTLRLLVLGGEPIQPTDLQAYAAVHPDILFVNHYGPTETTIGTVAQEIRAAQLPGFAELPVIGLPIANNDLFVLKDGHYMPFGEMGELYVSGPGLAFGYIKKPALEQERFVHLFGRRLYRTGDLVKRLPTGQLLFCGRADFQLKIRGYRVEPAEIEATLCRHPAIRSALVMSVTPEGGNPLVAAFVEPVAGLAAPPETAVADWLALLLPAYMIPQRFIMITPWPLTANGKVDRQALLARWAAQAASATGEIPANATEQLLLSIWQEVLQRTDIGLTANFFKSGGHSLSAMQVIARVAARMGVQIGLADLFAHPTVASLAAALGGASQAAAPVQALPEQPFYELSHSQQRLWINQQLQPDNNSYNVAKALVLPGAVDDVVLRNVIQALATRHESLRTIFRELDGRPVQCITPVTDFAGYPQLTTAASMGEAHALLADFTALPFNLETGPLFRSKLVSVDGGPAIFIFVLHHIVADAISKDILVRESQLLYEAFIQGQPSPLSPLPVQYRDYAAWERQQLTPARKAWHRQYWQRKLAGPLPALQLPADKPRPAHPTHLGKLVSCTPPAAVGARLLRYCEEEAVSLFILLEACIKTLLFRCSGQEDIIIGTPVSGRHQQVLENQVGLYLNTLPLRTRFAGHESFRTLLHRVARETPETLQHQLYPFDLLVEDLALPPSLGRFPLFDVVLVVGPSIAEESAPDHAGPARMQGIDTGFRTSNADLRFVFYVQQGQLKGYLDFDTDIFLPATAAALVAMLQHILNAVVTNPDIAIADIPAVHQPEPLLAPAVDDAFNFHFE